MAPPWLLSPTSKVCSFHMSSDCLPLPSSVCGGVRFSLFGQGRERICSPRNARLLRARVLDGTAASGSRKARAPAAFASRRCASMALPFLRSIVDYTYPGVNNETVRLAPPEAMQFGKALQRGLAKVVHADPYCGPVSRGKTDIADGFFRIGIQACNVGVILQMATSLCWPFHLPCPRGGWKALLILHL